MTGDWWLIIDCLHTDDTEGCGCPQADGGGERKLKRINRELKEMGPQADDGGGTSFDYSHIVSIKRSSSSYASFWWTINDFVHTENTEGNGGPQADGFVGKQQLSSIGQQLKEKYFF